ncbi:MAG: hypothetical protein JST40_00155 [Armatimonadetes bacterium]|nr:hypothetical protein [Armatimonadota bacterium]
MSHDHLETHDGDYSHHVVPISKLITTFILLIVLMAATVFASTWHLGDAWYFSVFANLLALGIAVTKALLVISYFMGAKWASNLSKMFIIGGFGWFTTMYFMFLDYGTRQWEPIKGWERDASTALPRFKDLDENPEAQDVGQQPASP